MIKVSGTANPNNCDLLDNPAFIRFVNCLAMMIQKYGHNVLETLDDLEET